MYQNSKDSYFFEDFQITSSFDEEQIRTIEINSPDIITGEIVGKYKVNQKCKKENALGSLYANYSPNQLEKGQFINFDLSIYDKIVEVFIPDVKILKILKQKVELMEMRGNLFFDFTSPNIIVLQ